ncbi:NUDIX hydrolase domain-like protein [Trichoderma austrokoningii]
MPFTFNPSLTPLAPLPLLSLSSKSTPPITHLMTSVFLLRQQHQNEPPQILLLRRSPQDSYPLKWEAPGGSVDSDDASILAAAARELFEETALSSCHFHAVLGMTKQEAEQLFSSTEDKRPDNWGVDPNDERAEDIEVQVSEHLTILLTTFHEPDGIWGKVNFLATAAEEQVKIDTEEHVEWAWFTEEQVRCGRADKSDIVTEGVFTDDEQRLDADGRRVLEFTSQAVWGSVLEAFGVGREMGIIV